MLTLTSSLARWSRSAGAVTLASLCALGVAGCGDDHADHEHQQGDAATFACAQQTDTFSVGMTKLGAQGHFRVALLDADPAPPARYENSWIVTVTDASGAAVTGATLSVNPDMPEHGHGVLTPVVVTESGGGNYQLNPIALHMPGYWEVPISVSAGGMTDTAMFAFCILP